jgi:hypothetical protein
MDTRKHNWGSKFHESYNRVGRGHRWRCGCEGIKCPAARDEKARTRPHSNSVFHAAPLLRPAPIIPLIPPNSKHDFGPRFHRWCNPQCLVNPPKVVIHEAEHNGSSIVLDFLRERIREASERRILAREGYHCGIRCWSDSHRRRRLGLDGCGNFGHSLIRLQPVCVLVSIGHNDDLVGARLTH